jgi:hypothetical protein
MVSRSEDTKKMTRQVTKLVREGRYAAEVVIDLVEDDTGWSPYLSLEDAKKLDAMRIALKAGDLVSASRLGRVFELMPVQA